jgi:hypothetical protein
MSLSQNQQMHKIINKYKMYLQTLLMFRQINFHPQGVLSRNFKELEASSVIRDDNSDINRPLF